MRLLLSSVYSSYYGENLHILTSHKNSIVLPSKLPDEDGYDEKEQDAHRLALLFVPPLLARASKSDLLLKLLRSAEFRVKLSSKATMLEEVEGAMVAITAYLTVRCD